MADYKIDDIYQGGYSSFSPSYGDFFTGYRMGAKNIGITTDGRTANILQSLSEQISRGLKTIEVGSISPEVFESIPRQQLKEVNKLSELTGVDLTVHAPVVEPSGINSQGHFSETGREAIERQISHFVKTAHEMSPEGNIPVTLHSSATLPWETPSKGKLQEDVLVIDLESGAIGKIPVKKRTFPGEEEKPEIQTEINKLNQEQWSKKISNLSYYTALGGERISGVTEYLSRGAEAEEKAGIALSEAEKNARIHYKMGANIIEDNYRLLKDLFEQAKKYGNESDRILLKKFSDEITPQVEKINEDPKNINNAKLMINILERGVETFHNLEAPPQVYRSLNDLAKEKSTETFANVALNSWEKFKDKSPIISVENPPAGGAFSTGEELKKFVETIKEKFVESAVKKGLMSSSQAKQQADRLIGVTWDVGHINMMRKYGYDEKDVVKQTEEVAPLVKHIHLSDNFGFEHTELPMGMGNVPIKEMMEKLPEKDVKKIVEAISYYQHFKIPAVTPTLEAFGSSFYSNEMPPYWNQSLGFQRGYMGGYGNMLPQTNYETFGAGFSQLPSELGGQRAGAGGSRMSGRPME